MNQRARLLTTLLFSVTFACSGSNTSPTGSPDLSASSDGSGGGAQDLSGVTKDGAGSGGHDLSGGGTSDLSGGGTSSGDCKTDSDCPGGKCVAVYPGGFKVCQTPPTVATSCAHQGFDKCCKSSDCVGAGQQCFLAPVTPICSGVAILQSNVCASNMCTTSADCANNGVCVAAGELGFKVNGCLPAGCHVDADCTAKAGGVCAPVKESCCGTTIGLYCVYPSTGCRSNSDCIKGDHCVVQGANAVCVPGVTVCPA